MIRINLLGRPRPKVKRKIAIAGTLQAVLFVIPVAVALLLLGGHQYFLSREVVTLQEQIDDLERKKREMGELEKKIEEFKKKEAVLIKRQEVIGLLRKKQQGPAQLLDALGGTVNRTDTLWLTRLDQRGNKLTLEGVARSVNAVANFITNLKGSGLFANIEIKEAVQSTDNPEIEKYTFSLTCEFVLPATPVAGAGN